MSVEKSQFTSHLFAPGSLLVIHFLCFSLGQAHAVAIVGLALTYIIAVAQGHRLGIFVVGCALVWGPIFLFIAWATRRALRNRGRSDFRDQKP